ncbi:monocarboxylate transporter 3 [Ixodes scapularis]|uniref:monocarboxylate transporter 3 n=1 Tax=Ixodes scapularis TaxID=6945 RepID=UPI001A9F1613|nr:monocarboxylate transporter 3 [Ixodes scapularis]
MGSAVGNRWLVAVACCWMNLFCFAMLRSTAVIYVAVLHTFHVTRGQAAWPLSLTGFFYTFTAPAVGVLARYFSVWKLTLAGSVGGAISVSLCYFADDVPYLIVCYGISQGISIAFTSLTHTVINQSFDQYKAVASGISNAGFTIGSLVFPLVLQFFFDRYGVRAGFLLCGALMLNAAAASLLQRDCRVMSVATSHEKARHNPRKTEESQEDALRNDSSRAAEERSMELLPMSEQTSRKGSLSTRDEESDAPLSSSITENPRADQLHVQNLEFERIQVQAAENKYDVSRKIQNLVPELTLRSRIVGSLSFLVIPKFYIVAISFSQLIVCITTYLTVIVDFAKDQGIPKWNAVLLITFCAAADMAARLASGWFTDRGFLRRSTMMTLHLFLSAMALFLVPLCNSYFLMVLMSVIVGWCNGATVILIPVFLMELVEAGKFSVCYGTATLLSGLPMLVRPLVIGYFRDTLGHYRGLFWLLGTLSACNVVLWSWIYLRERQTDNCNNLNKLQRKKHSQA